MSKYEPRPEWIEAEKRVQAERKARAEKVLNDHLLKVEKEKLERQKGKRNGK